MQLTIGNLINYIINKKLLVAITFLISLILYPIQYYTFDQNTSQMKFIIDNFDDVSDGNSTQSKAINIFKKRMLYGYDLINGMICITTNKEGFNGQNLECTIKKISNKDLKTIEASTVKFINKEYILSLKTVRKFSEDISRMESVYENRKALSVAEVEEIINNEIKQNKYLMINVMTKKNIFDLFRFFSFIVLINSLMIGYLIITHPKMKL